MYDESFRDFKNYFFKVRAIEGARPFFLDENDEPAFPLEWQQNVVVSRYSWKMLDEVEQALVTMLEENWGQPPHLDTKKFLGDPSLLRAELGSGRLLLYLLCCFILLSLSLFFSIYNLVFLLHIFKDG